MPAVQPVRPQLIADATGTKARATGESATGNQEEDVQLKKAIKESKDLNENDDKSLQRALQMSMEGESWLQSTLLIVALSTRQNSLLWLFDWHKIFTQEATINQNRYLCKQCRSRIYTVCLSVFDFWLTSLLTTVDVSKFKLSKTKKFTSDRSLGMKGLK